MASLVERIAAMEQDAAPLNMEQQTHKVDIQRLGADVEGLRNGQYGLEKRLSEALHNLGTLHERADTLGEQVGGLEQVAIHLAALDEQSAGLQQTQEVHQNGIAGLLGRLTALGEGVHETTDLIGQEAKRLSALQDQFESDSQELHRMAAFQARQRDELDTLISRLDELAQGRAQDSQDARTDLESLQAQLAEFESGLHSLDEHSKLTDARLERAAEDLSALREHTDTVAARLDALSEVPERVSDLETLTGPMNNRLDSQDDSLVQLREQLDRLEQAAEELAGRVADEAGRIAVQAEKSESDQDRLAALIQEVSQNGMDLSAVISKLDSLQESDGQLERNLLETSERANRLADQDRYLEGALEAAREKFSDFGSALDNTGSSIDAVQRDYHGLDGKLVDLRSGQRVMAWSGVVAAVVLLTLSVAGYLLSESKQGVEREDVAGRLDQMERRMAGFMSSDGEAVVPDQGPKIEGLRQRMDTLDQRVSDLSVSVAQQPDFDAGEQGQGQAERDNMLLAMDDLSQRLGQLETAAVQVPVSVSSPVDKGADGAEPASPPRPDNTAEVEGPWAKGRRSGAYTVQVLGVRDPASLRAYVRKKGLQGDLAQYRTELGGKPWYVLFQGIHAKRGDAGRAAKLSGGKNWARLIPKDGDIQPLLVP